MNRYELYVVDDKGILHPTGLWKRGYKFNDVEIAFSKLIRQINKPCVITLKAL